MDEKKNIIQFGNKIYNLDVPKEMEAFFSFIFKDVLLFPNIFPSTNKIIFLAYFLTILSALTGIFLAFILTIGCGFLALEASAQ